MRQLPREAVVLRTPPRRPPLLPLHRQPQQLLPGGREKGPGRRALHGEPRGHFEFKIIFHVGNPSEIYRNR